MKRKISVLFFLFFLIACAAVEQKPSPLTPQQQLLMEAEIAYIDQYNDAMEMAGNPDLSDAQKDILKLKKAILIKVQPMIRAYSVIVMGGGIPNESDGQAIKSLLNSIGSHIK